MTTEQFQIYIREVPNLAGGLRSTSFVKAIELAHRIGSHRFVETGCVRTPVNCPDGNSTVIFAKYAVLADAEFHSVDINPECIARCKHAMDENDEEAVIWHEQDSVAWLSKFDFGIDFLYLDSYDFHAENPGPSQRHQLAEIGAALGKMPADSIILLDDQDGLPHGGKGGLSTLFLSDRGWKCIHEGYQRIYVNFEI